MGSGDSAGLCIPERRSLEVLLERIFRNGDRDSLTGGHQRKSLHNRVCLWITRPEGEKPVRETERDIAPLAYLTLPHYNPDRFQVSAVDVEGAKHVLIENLSGP